MSDLLLFGQLELLLSSTSGLLLLGFLVILKTKQDLVSFEPGILVRLVLLLKADVLLPDDLYSWFGLSASLEGSLFARSEHFDVVVVQIVEHIFLRAELIPNADLLLASGMNSQVTDSIRAILPSEERAVLEDDVLVHEVVLAGLDWSLGHPNVAVGPLHLAKVLLPVAVLIEVDDHEEIRTWHGLVVDFQGHRHSFLGFGRVRAKLSSFMALGY